MLVDRHRRVEDDDVRAERAAARGPAPSVPVGVGLGLVGGARRRAGGGHRATGWTTNSQMEYPYPVARTVPYIRTYRPLPLTLTIWVPPVPLVIVADGVPVRVVVGHLDLEVLPYAVSQLMLHLADRLDATQVDLQPLRVAERAGPAGGAAAVDRGRGRGTRVLGGRRGGRLVQRDVGAVLQPVAASGSAGGAGRAVDLELPQRVPVLGRPRGAVHPHVPAAAGDVVGLVAAGTAGDALEHCPVGAVAGRLQLERGRVRGLPVQLDLGDRGDLAEVDLEPLRVGERARPAGTGRVAVDGRRRRRTGVLGGRRGGRLALREQPGGGIGRQGGDRRQPTHQGEHGGGDDHSDSAPPPGQDGDVHGLPLNALGRPRRRRGTKEADAEGRDGFRLLRGPIGC